MTKKECVAMILAGGQGSRLGVLTKSVAKPAVPFGGKYRIIDFPLSNCHNSGLDTVGVLTQYQPFALHSYLGIGSPWDLDRRDGGVFVLPPFVRAKGGERYKGTANAIFQNANFIDQFNPDYVLILSGDHIYKMDYAKMLAFHKEKQADATIAVIEVPWDEASRFGIMNTNPDSSIAEFEEKPKKPKNNLASMGVYIFNWPILKKYLIADDEDKSSSNDFGKNIIPKMLGDGRSMVAFPFKGYWKDVGTVESLWEANMDLLADNPPFSLHEDEWRIYSVNPVQPPHYVAAGASVTGSLVSEGCDIEGQVSSSVLFPGVTVGAGAIIKESVILPGVTIGKGCRIERTIIGNDAALGDNCEVGCSGEASNITVVGEQADLAPGTVVPRGAVAE